MKCLKFEIPKHSKNRGGLFRKTLMLLISFLFPKANPDFENNIQNVKKWIVEFDRENIPTREIGVDENDKVILKMPYKNNYGFWTDNELLFSDFVERFSATEVENEYFNKKWNEFNL